jgi:hypothetical protein
MFDHPIIAKISGRGVTADRNDLSRPLPEGPVGMDRIGLERPARYNEHSLIEGYCLNLRQYSRSAPKDQSF